MLVPMTTATDTSREGQWRVYGPQDLPGPLACALNAFFEHGYHGTTIRDVANRAKLSVPGLYHYYPSKQALLTGLTDAVMKELLGRSRVAIEEAGNDPVDQFRAFVENFVRYHMFRRKQAFVASSEIRSLETANRKRYVKERDSLEAMFLEIIERGRAQDLFSTPFPRDAARAILTMCVGIASWYKPDGPLDADDLVARYLDFAQIIVSPPR